MKKGKVFYRDSLAGILIEDENGYSFTYDEGYIQTKNAKPVSLTLPLKVETFRNFRGLQFSCEG